MASQQVVQPTSLGSILGSIGSGIKDLAGQYITLDAQRRAENEAEARAAQERAINERNTNIVGQFMPQMSAFAASMTAYAQENPMVKYGGIVVGVGLAVTVIMYMRKR